jgi:hypothetical protein
VAALGCSSSRHFHGWAHLLPAGYCEAEDDDAVKYGGADVQQHPRLLEEDIQAGVKSFYRGALSNMFRSTGAAAILVLYDELKMFMNRGRL